MSQSSTLTIDLPRETQAKLDRLADHTSRTQVALAGEALARYVDRELAIVEAIERGREEIHAGLGLETEDVFRDVESAIAGVEAGPTKS